MIFTKKLSPVHDTPGTALIIPTPKTHEIKQLNFIKSFFCFQPLLNTKFLCISIKLSSVLAVEKPKWKGYLDPYNKSNLECMFSLIKRKFELRANFSDLTDATVTRLQLKLHRLLQSIRKWSGSRAIKKQIEKKVHKR